MAITVHAAATPVQATIEGVSVITVGVIKDHWAAISQVMESLGKLQSKCGVPLSFKLLDEPTYTRISKWKLIAWTRSDKRSNLLEALALTEHFKKADDGSWKGYIETGPFTVFTHAVDSDGELMLTISYGG